MQKYFNSLYSARRTRAPGAPSRTSHPPPQLYLQNFGNKFGYCRNFVYLCASKSLHDE